ncbi:MAG: zinc ABC transporter substrate-binding protein [Propionibacteriaceae bacterium]|nr:zinc ABC transporter substrate-binding protein [Propionibacteriaceae bacterium]
MAIPLALTACADAAPESSTSAAAQDRIAIVASTNVYASIAAAIAGDRADVVSFINSSTQDPHEYEATAQDRLAIEGADIVVENGGGFDHFMDVLLEGAQAQPAVLNAVATSGLVSADQAQGDTEIEGFNEHVWYKFDAMDALALRISGTLSDLDPDSAAAYADNYQRFSRELADLSTAATSLKASFDGQGVAITEPVPLYLLEAVGLVNKTPEDFTEAVEEGEDVPPRALLATLDLFSGQQVSLLAYNDQTADAATEQVRAAAEAAGIPVVNFSEILPAGKDYIQWQQANLDNLEAVLAK